VDAPPVKLDRREALSPEGRSNPLSLISLMPLIERTRGDPEIMIGLIDGPVDSGHPGLNRASLKEFS